MKKYLSFVMQYSDFDEFHDCKGHLPIDQLGVFDSESEAYEFSKICCKKELEELNCTVRKDAGYTYEQFGEYMIYNVSSEESCPDAIFGVMEIDA